jgi:hypothetical protein
LSPPSLRTVQADLPHTALQSVVLPRRGLARQRMGCFQAIQPVFGKEGVPPSMMTFAAFDPLLEGCQQPLCPNRRVGPEPHVQGLSGTYSPFGHCRRLVFRRSDHRVSTFLHPFAPPALPGFFATMGALTPGRPALRFPKAHEHRLWRRPGIPAFCHRIFRSFCLQPPTVVPARLWGFLCQAYRTTWLWPPLIRGLCVSWASPLRCRFATTVGRIEFTCITD